MLKLFEILPFGFFFGSCNKIEESETLNAKGLFAKVIIINSKTRRYAIYIHRHSKNTDIPLFFKLQRGGVSIEYMTGESGIEAPYKLRMNCADNKKSQSVYPVGLLGSYAKHRHYYPSNATVYSSTDDVSFISSLIDSASSRYEIDRNRICSPVASNGRLMTLRFAISLSGKIATAMPCSPECGQLVNPISILFMYGINDKHLSSNGGFISNPSNFEPGSVFSTEKPVNILTSFNQTDTIPVDYNFPELITNGIEATAVILHKINGGGHSASNIKERYLILYEYYFNKQNHDVEMTTEVWNFFKTKLYISISQNYFLCLRAVL